MNVCFFEMNNSNDSFISTTVDLENMTGAVFFAIDEKYRCIDPYGLLDYCITPRTRKEIDAFLRICGCEKSRIAYMKPLINAGFIMHTRPHVKQSPLQQFYTDRTVL